MGFEVKKFVEAAKARDRVNNLLEKYMQADTLADFRQQSGLGSSALTAEQDSAVAKSKESLIKQTISGEISPADAAQKQNLFFRDTLLASTISTGQYITQLGSINPKLRALAKKFTNQLTQGSLTPEAPSTLPFQRSMDEDV